MTITPEQLATMRDDAARHASAQAEVPSCDFTHDLDEPINHDAVWCFGEIIVDGGNKRSIALCAPSAIVDDTPPAAFARAIVASRAAVPCLASDVLTLCAEVEQLRALEAVAHRHRHACLGACGCSVCDWIVASRKEER